MSELELRLNSRLQEDPEGSILLRRDGERLNAWQLIDGERYHLNPFSFGLPFSMRTLPSADFSVLDNFLRKGRRKQEAYSSSFPRSSQIEIMEFYLKDEHGIKLSFAQRDTFCELFEQLFPVYWRYAITSHSCILYDGFYGRGPSEAYLPYQSSATYEELIEGVFGEVRKDTLREGRNIDAMGLNLAYIFRGILPLDVIVKELSTQEGHFAEFPLTLEPYKNLLRLSPVIRRRLFVDLIVDFKLDAQIVSDALDLLSVIPEAKLHRLKGTVSWNQLHRRLMAHCEAVKGEEVIHIPSELTLLTEPLFGISFSPLQSAGDFVALGDWLDICIGKAGYFMRAVRGESFCLAGLKDEEPYAALEVKSVEGRWLVSQLRRAHNEPLKDQKAIIELIEERLNA